MRKIFLLIPLLLLMIGCAKAPYTGRNQVIMISPQEEMALGYQAEKQILSHDKLSHNPKYISMVDRVGERIAKATGLKLDWKFYVIDKPDVANAFCLANGHVFVYTGLFKYIHNDAQLATVIGHEVGHAIAHHVAERMSVALMTNLATAAGAAAINSKVHNRDTRALYDMALGLGANLGVMLPYSRMQESEADHIGLMLMAKACYDPHEAIKFWENFAKAQKGHQPPVYFSDHPSDAERIANLKKLLPLAMKYYRESRCQERKSKKRQAGGTKTSSTPRASLLGAPVD